MAGLLRDSLRHKLYVTLMTDLSDLESSKVLAVAWGKCTAVAKYCLGKLTPQQRAAGETHRLDMGKVYGHGQSMAINVHVLLCRKPAMRVAGA